MNNGGCFGKGDTDDDDYNQADYTNPLNPDTDGDGVLDGVDKYPRDDSRS